MSQLSNYRSRLNALLNAADIEQALLAEGLPSALAARVARSRGVVAQASLARRVPKVSNSVHEAFGNDDATNGTDDSKKAKDTDQDSQR